MKLKQKLEARELRKQGLSIREICDRLAVAKSSVSLWVRDIQLSDEQIDALNQKLIQNRCHFGYLSRCGSANRNREEAEARHKLYQEAGFERARIDEDFRLICALYWGEGQKCSRGVFGVSNCDPALLQVVLRWLLGKGFDDRIGFTVQYYAENGLTEKEIKEWWRAQLPGLRGKHLRKFIVCKINRASQKKRIGKRPYGTATVRVAHTELFFNVLGGINYLKEWAIGETASRHAYTVESGVQLPHRPLEEHTGD